MQANSCKR